MRYELYFGYDSSSTDTKMYKVGTYTSLKAVNERIQQEKREWCNPFRLSTMTCSKVVKIYSKTRKFSETTLYTSGISVMN